MIRYSVPGCRPVRVYEFSLVGRVTVLGGSVPGDHHKSQNHNDSPAPSPSSNLPIFLELRKTCRVHTPEKSVTGVRISYQNWKTPLLIFPIIFLLQKSHQHTCCFSPLQPITAGIRDDIPGHLNRCWVNSNGSQYLDNTYF